MMVLMQVVTSSQIGLKICDGIGYGFNEVFAVLLFLVCFMNMARGLSGSSGNSFSISSRQSIARSNRMKEAKVIPVEEPFSKELMVKTLNPDFSATSF